MNALRPTSESAIRRLIEDLVKGAYARLAADGRLGRLTVNELQKAIAEYGKTLTLPPDSLEGLDTYPIDGKPGHFSIDVPLWTLEEGRSDLTVSASVTEHADGSVLVAIDDVHVL
jgi:hypothetical protein